MASGIVNGTANNPQKTAKAKETDAMRLADRVVTSGYVAALGIPLEVVVGTAAPDAPHHQPCTPHQNGWAAARNHPRPAPAGPTSSTARSSIGTIVAHNRDLINRMFDRHRFAGLNGPSVLGFLPRARKSTAFAVASRIRGMERG